jgi:hypothetical protein
MSWSEAAKQYARSARGTGMRAVEIDDIIELSFIIGSFRNSKSGLASMLLLEVSEKLIACGQDKDWLYFWGPLGATKVSLTAPALFRRPIPIYASDMARMFIRNGKKPHEVLPFLRDEIDKIAREAPSPVTEE